MVLLVFRDPDRKGTSVEEIYQGIFHEFKTQMDIAIYFYNDQKGMYRNIKAILAFNPDVIHVTSDIYFIVPWIRNRKTIITIHDIGRYKELTGIKKWVYRWIWLKWPALKADKIITVSDFTKRDLQKLLPQSLSSKLIRIYNPVPVLFKPQPKEMNGSYPTILQVGTNPNKNVEKVIQALAGIPCHLILIGKLSPYQVQLLQHSKIDYSDFSGLSYEEVCRKYIQSDLVLFVSTHEGFGMPIIEAKAPGRPVICSMNSSLPELADNAALFVVDVNSVDEIREKINILLSDTILRKQLIENGYQNIKRFAMAEIVQQYLEVYRMYDKVKLAV